MSQRAPAPLNFVRSFECAARHLSFTRAAEELGYTQAAISVHIRSLETYIGAELFHRRPRSLQLTETGQAFLPTLRQALRMIDHATEGVAGGDRRRTVTLTCPISLAENWLAQRLAGFHEAHPSIEIIVHGTVWDASTVQQADLVISMHRHADASSGSVRLFQETLVLLAPPRIAARVQTTGDLAAERKIVVLGRQDYWSAFEDALGASFDLAVALRTNATNIALEFAASGAGVTPSPIEVAQSYIDRGLLQAVTDQRPLCPWSYYLSEARPSTHSSVITVRDWLLRGEDWVHGMSAD